MSTNDLLPLPWPDIKAWLEVSSAEEIAAGIRAYARAAIEAEREAEREACAKEIERTYGINAAVIRARGKS